MPDSPRAPHSPRRVPSGAASTSESSLPESGPDWKEHLRPRLAELRLSAERESEIIDELAQHLEDRYQQLRADGADDDEARRLALEELREPDAIERQMQSLRQAHVLAPMAPGLPRRGIMADLRQDVQYALRMLRKQPGFATAAVLTLALGIGANAAVFSLVNATLLQPLPFADRERLVYVYRGNVGNVFSYPFYSTLRDHSQMLEGLAGWGGITASFNAGDSAELVSGLIVTGNFFDVLGVRAARGRLLSRSDDETPGGEPVAVISHEFWQTRFGGRPDVIGADVRLNGHRFTIIGVTPAGFPGALMGVRQLYVPMMMQAVMRPPRARYSGEQDPDLLRHHTNSWIAAIARLKPGATIEQARAELDPIAAEYVRTQMKSSATPPKVLMLPIEEGNAGPRNQLQSVALLLGGVVGAVLLIACANIANLLLSRATTRRRELAVRVALGASRGRIVQQLLTESVLLSLIGGVAGMVVAWGALQLFDAAPPPAGALPLTLDFSMDWRVLLFSLLLSLLTGVLFGVVPALQASRPGLVPALKNSETTGGERRSRLDLKRMLVVGEVALSLLLLIAAGLFVRSLQAARAIDPGVDVERLVSAPLGINLLRYTRAQGREFYRAAVERVERVPGVESASVARVALLGGTGRVLSLHVEGRDDSHDQVSSEGTSAVSGDPRVINANVVGPGFFKTVGIPLLHGRDFGSTDVEGGPPVVVLNATAARMHFAVGNAIGGRVSVDGPKGPWREVVGVVRDAKYGGLAEEAVPVVYMPLSQNHETGMFLYVRASVPPASIVAALRHEIQGLEPNLPVPNIRTMIETIGSSLYPARMGAWLLGVFGGLALLLAVIGIYGVLSFSISQRTREMGIRIALGADTQRVFLLVVRDGMLLVGLGILIGVAGGLAGARWLDSFLYGVSTTDLPTFSATVAILAVVALAACAVPARRAVRVSPMSALRQE